MKWRHFAAHRWRHIAGQHWHKCERYIQCPMTGSQRYVYYMIMYSAHVELAVSPVNAGHLVGAVSRCYT
uniref:Uncharacterized protein n=1 Tax=mine drainage metagenome TaxID=410659 RepID=E6QC78_9ZZZZ